MNIIHIQRSIAMPMRSSIRKDTKMLNSLTISLTQHFIVHATLYSLNMQKEWADGEESRKAVREISKCKRLE